MPTSIFSPVMLLICSALILLRLRRLKWRKRRQLHPNEIAFSKSNKAYDEDWSGDKSGISLYKAAAKFKYGPVWARGRLHSANRSNAVSAALELYAGTYQGAEAGANFDYGDAGALSSPTCGPTNTKRRGIWKWMSFSRTIKPPKLIICTP